MEFILGLMEIITKGLFGQIKDKVKVFYTIHQVVDIKDSKEEREKRKDREGQRQDYKIKYQEKTERNLNETRARGRRGPDFLRGLCPQQKRNKSESEKRWSAR